jgi:hypothetical protein
MKNKNKSALRSTRNQDKINNENDRRQAFWRRIKLQLAAIFLVVVFLDSECVTLLPTE